MKLEEIDIIVQETHAILMRLEVHQDIVKNI